MWNDVRYALRMTLRTPLFTAAVVLTVALAIAANTAVFSVVYAVLLKPLRFREPDRLMLCLPALNLSIRVASFRLESVRSALNPPCAAATRPKLT